MLVDNAPEKVSDLQRRRLPCSQKYRYVCEKIPPLRKDLP